MIKNSVYNNYKNLDDKKFKEAVGIPKIEEQIKGLDNNMPKSYTRENVK